MSKQSDEVYTLLKELFPANVIIKEHYVKYKYTRLFFDFYMKDLGVLIEVQGRQHVEFVEHFHGHIDNFRGQKKRDNMKRIYVEENPNLTLVRFYYNEKITKKLILDKLCKALGGCFYE